jgi:hypothetical protein
MFTFLDLITFTHGLILSHFYVFLTVNNMSWKFLIEIFPVNPGKTIRIYIQGAVNVVSVTTT